VFGWIKQWGGLRQFKLRGTDKVSAVWTARDRLQPDPAAQSADRPWCRHEQPVAQRSGKRPLSGSPNRAKRLKPGILCR